MEFEIIELECFGNDEEGYEVNDAHYTGDTITISDNATDKEIITALEQFYNLPEVVIDGDMSFSLYIDEEVNAKPLLELRRLH